MKKRYLLLSILASLALSGCNSFEDLLGQIYPSQQQEENKEPETQQPEDTTEEGQTTEPQEGQTTTPGQGQTTEPEQGQTTTPEQGQTTEPEQGQTTNPEQGQTTNPEQGQTTNPSTPTQTSADVVDYYKNISTTATGKTLKTQLFNLIKIEDAGWSYDGLWEAYRKTDVRPDGTYFWDIYSDTTKYTLYDSRINHNYSKEGDSINREHVIPQSSFNEAKPMKSDIHHVLPSDGYVNNRRSNYPHGNVSGKATYTSNDGCKLGTGTGNTTVFEPMPQYKGDIARIYFYFVTCYENKMSSNSFSAFDRSTFPSIKSPFLELYLQWHLDDPVSEKEIIRNNEAYKGQGNRNPFIDYPDFATRIWGN